MSTLDPWNYALVSRAVFTNSAITVLVLHHHRIADTIKHQIAMLFRKLRPRLVEVDVVLLGHSLEHPREILRVRRPPWRYRAFIDTHASIRDDQVDVNFKFSS